MGCARPERLQELADALTPRELIACCQKWLAFTQELCVVLFGPKLLSSISVLTVAAMRLDVRHGAEPLAVATAPVRAAGS